MLILKGSLCNIEAAISDFVQEKARQSGLGNKRTWELLLALDEICSSLVFHNGCVREDHEVRLSWQEDSDSITVCLFENGVPFNPFVSVEEEAGAEEETRQLGGMSHELLGRMVDEMSYEHRDGWNCLTIRKYLQHHRRRSSAV